MHNTRNDNTLQYGRVAAGSADRRFKNVQRRPNVGKVKRMRNCSEWQGRLGWVKYTYGNYGMAAGCTITSRGARGVGGAVQ